MPTPSDLMLQASCALDLAERHGREASNLQAMIDAHPDLPPGPGILADLQACIQCAASERQRAALLKHEADELAREIIADRYRAMSGRQLAETARTGSDEVVAEMAGVRS